MRALHKHELKRYGYGLTAYNTAIREKTPYVLKRCFMCKKFYEPDKLKERCNPHTGKWGLMCHPCKRKNFGDRPEKCDLWRYYVKESKI